MPKDIARVLGISDKTLRQWLRDNPQVIHARSERWLVNPADAERIVEAYRKDRHK